MEALAARSDVVGFSMPTCSHITNYAASGFVRTYRNDFAGKFSHNPNMARRGVPKGPVNWHLREWMDYLGVKQADMCRLTDWSKASMSQLYNGVQDYSPKLVNEAARALHVAPYELLMVPERAMALRRLHDTAVEIVRSDDSPPVETAQQADRKTGTRGT